MNDAKTPASTRGPRATWIPVRDGHGRVHLEARWLDARDLTTSRRSAPAA